MGNLGRRVMGNNVDLSKRKWDKKTRYRPQHSPCHIGGSANHLCEPLNSVLFFPLEQARRHGEPSCSACSSEAPVQRRS